MYRDASNYKQHNEAVVYGTLTEAQKQEIQDALSEGEYFIPCQVGLPEKRFDKVNLQDDHCWFELQEIVETDAEPTEGISAEEVYQNFLNVQGKWDEFRWLLNVDIDNEEQGEDEA